MRGSVPVVEQYTRSTENARASFPWGLSGGRRGDDGGGISGVWGLRAHFRAVYPINRKREGAVPVENKWRKAGG